MAKQKTKKIPEDTANHARWLSDDTCCICHERGKDIQLHHIDEDPQNHVIKNLAVLCMVEGLVGISEFDYDDWQQLWRDSEILQ